MSRVELALSVIEVFVPSGRGSRRCLVVIRIIPQKCLLSIQLLLGIVM